MAVSLAWWVLFATCFGTESSPLLLQKKIHLADTPKPKRSLEEQLEVLEVTDLHDLAGKSVYLVMIDRFSREGGHSSEHLEACEGGQWCNGTLKGITSHLDYISAMGFDCIWVTPVVKNFYGPDLGESGYGYHGYWAEDFYSIDPNFGTKDDLKELVQQTHRHGMCFILDIVLNHIRPVHSLSDLSKVKPFNDTRYLHLLNMSGMSFDKYAEKGANWPFPIQALGPGAQCLMNTRKDGTPDGTNSGTYCNNYPENNYSQEHYFQERAHGPPHLKYCGTGDYLCRGYNETVIQDGWFYDLADLDQSVPFVREFLKDWVKYMATEFDVDGIRLDTTPHLPYDFLKEVQEMLMSLSKPISILGEVTTVNMSFHASYQNKDGQPILGGLENFPLSYNAVPGYCGWPNSVLSPVAQFDLTYLASASELQLTSNLYSDTDLLMNMMDNQDDAPIAGLYHISAGPFSPGTGGCQDDESLLLNGWAWLMFAKGMPVVAWGDEQGNSVYRMSLWQYGWRRDAWQYRLLSRMNAIRKERRLAKASAQVRFGSKDQFVFQRGPPNSKHSAWIFTNNLPNCSGRITYPIAPPAPPSGMYWTDALFNQPFEIFGDKITARTKPLVLVLDPPAKSDSRVVSGGNGFMDRVKSPRMLPGVESAITREIVETPRRLDAQPNLAGERLVSRESREVPAGQIALQFPQKLMAFGNVASERLAQEKPDHEAERERFEGSFRAYDRGLPVSYNEMVRNVSEKAMVPNLESHLPRREHSQRVDSYGEMTNSFVKSDTERSEGGLQPANVRLRENVDAFEDNRGNFQALASYEKLSPPDQMGSDSELEDDFNTKCELRRIASSFVPLKTDLENKENTTIFSLRPFRSEAERKQIRENIDRLRSMAKRRNSKDRFMVFSRRKDLRSPTTILNSVTSAISDVAGVESVEKEMRMKLAELQKKYREKARELARLQPKYGVDDGNGKSTPIKRGPGRPRKRKYFGASSKGDKTSPGPPTGYGKEGEERLPISGTQSPELNAVASESESLVSKESEPPKKKKKRAKQKSPVERDERGSAPPSRGLSPVEFTDFPVPVGKKKKSRKPTGMEEEPTVALPKNKPTNVKKKGPGTGKRVKGSPTEDTLNRQTIPEPPAAISEKSANDFDSNADFTEPKNTIKNTKAKKPKPKKRARPKLTIETCEVYDDGKAEDELPPDSADTTYETPRPPSPTKGKKTKGTKKKRKSSTTTPPKAKFEFPEVTSQDDSFSENSSVSPNDIAKEVVAIAARKQLEAQKNNREVTSDVDDDVFSPSHDGRDGLSLLAQASFASVDKPAKRKRSEAVSPSEDLSQKKRGRPKKASESPPFEPDAPVTQKKKKKKKVIEEDSTKEPKKKKKKKKKDSAPKDESIDERPTEVPQDHQETAPSTYECHDEFDKKLPESSTAIVDSEQDEEVFRPVSEQSKEVRTTQSGSSTPRESDELKGSVSSLLSDEWQPRRSERIFINSSVTTNSSSSPLSPTGKPSEFSYMKKTKRMSVTKVKTSRSGSQGEEELGESDVISQKAKAKAKKKKGPGKGKKRNLSNAADFEDYEPSKLSRRARSKSRQMIEFDDADEEEADELQEEDEAHEEGETDVEINVTDKIESAEERAEEPSAQVASEENGNDVTPETELEPMEADKKDEKEQADVEMEGDEIADEENVIEETRNTEVPEKLEEGEGKEEVVKDEEMEEQEEALVERPTSPVDVRFTFLVDELVEGVKLLLPVDSVFYPGRISTFNEPDLFGVVLDGERGRRPHWKSTEQLLTEAVKDIQPPGDKFLSIGTRVCAHWSPQYRCFYPGTVTEAPPDEKEVNGKIWIEFDDGDSGFFQLDEIKRIHPDFPVEDAESIPTLPEKRSRSSSLGGATASSRLRLRAEENTSEFSSGNESSGELQSKRRRLRGKRKSKDDSWLPSKRLTNTAKETNKGEPLKNKTKDVEKCDTENMTRVKDKNQSGNDGQEIKVADAPKQKTNKVRGKTETKVENKETASRTAEHTKQDLATVASAELKESEKEIHLSDSSLKTEGYENNSKQTSEKTRTATDNTESSDQGEESEATSDVETSKHEKGPRAGTKSSSRTSEKDLRRRSLNLSLNSSFRSSRAEGESPTRDVLSTSQDEDSESYSDAFDESPLVENKSFQPRFGRRRRSEIDRLHVDMKYSGPLWQWSGRSFQNKRKGKGKKSFYKAIVRGDETISVGDCAVFMSNPTKHLNLPYVGRIENMWEGCMGNMVVRVKWFYHPEETKPGRRPSDGKQSLYRSTHIDENDVQTISHKCEVLTPEEFKRRSQSLDTPGTRTSLSDRMFCCIGSYDPNSETLQTEL